MNVGVAFVSQIIKDHKLRIVMANISATAIERLEPLTASQTNSRR